MHVVAKFASWIQSLNSNLDVATGNSHLGVQGTKEPAAQQSQRGVGFRLWGLGEKTGSKYGWFNHQIRVPHFCSHVSAYNMDICMKNSSCGLIWHQFTQFPWWTSKRSGCWQHRHHCATGIRLTFQDLEIFGVFRDFTGQASLISLRSNQNFILLGQTCCSSFLLWMHETIKEKNNSKNSESNLRIR